MKTLKALTLFVAGGVSTSWLLAKAIQTNTNNPREGAVVYENDEIKVTRVNPESNKKCDIATIVYKKKD